MKDPIMLNEGKMSSLTDVHESLTKIQDDITNDVVLNGFDVEVKQFLKSPNSGLSIRLYSIVNECASLCQNNYYSRLSIFRDWFAFDKSNINELSDIFESYKSFLQITSTVISYYISCKYLLMINNLLDLKMKMKDLISINKLNILLDLIRLIKLSLEHDTGIQSYLQLESMYDTLLVNWSYKLANNNVQKKSILSSSPMETTLSPSGLPNIVATLPEVPFDDDDDLFHGPHTFNSDSFRRISDVSMANSMANSLSSSLTSYSPDSHLQTKFKQSKLTNTFKHSSSVSPSTSMSSLRNEMPYLLTAFDNVKRLEQDINVLQYRNIPTNKHTSMSITTPSSPTKSLSICSSPLKNYFNSPLRNSNRTNFSHHINTE
ncbi:hypothetical protein TBLA_0C02210 [Henningerozyma blattae CBS 6284]|uniref:Uncharacterized protein n=1 Tax=Henningerozyma blattae (strain ATCC 34711 / CBS 6284 / DSM 70876 / NBRC 10599 / NRRL Y-10934 / UCD 77-7) TaxID=1071380 RepID=I2H0Y1_HENB6|nr:hypothetical protein TBLA_0C02210 [Tetrapisispora blattae CBS 6284]CCH60033.1 hypothetical protein TBLA_0C02210 [Tetrapisispora blattae CBS 6284]